MEKIMTDEWIWQDRWRNNLLPPSKTLRRRDTRAIRQVQGSLSNTATRPHDVSNTFLNYLRQKLWPIDIDSESLHRLQTHVQPLEPVYAECLEKPINFEEVITEIRSGGKHKTSTFDCKYLEFYSANWEVHLDKLFLSNKIIPGQKYVVFICTPISEGDTPNGYRPTTLRNTTLQNSGAEHSPTAQAGYEWTIQIHTILCSTGQLLPTCSIASPERNYTRWKHRYPLVHADVGYSKRLWPHLTQSFHILQK